MSNGNENVPEPTSLLSLLFGVGAIAVSKKSAKTKSEA
ncbi:PEP-CTERM sorting domain-containing protein (plasmid) [Nostoc sp. UHCC 0302]